jgi:hypothetical protein
MIVASVSRISLITIAPAFHAIAQGQWNNRINLHSHLYPKGQYLRSHKTPNPFHKFMNAINDPSLHPLSIKKVSALLARVSSLLLTAPESLKRSFSALLPSCMIDSLTMILVSFKALCLSLGVLSACIPVHGEESNKHSLRGGDTKTARLLTGDGGDVVTIDFDEYGLSGGDYVDTQYESAYGLTFSSQGTGSMRQQASYLRHQPPRE